MARHANERDDKITYLHQLIQLRYDLERITDKDLVIAKQILSRTIEHHIQEIYPNGK